ncbi:MAG: L,D-transpeptidase family protein [Allorhizobium sp.]
MRLKPVALLIILAAALAGCNDSIENTFDPSKISNKVEQPLPARILQQMKVKGMERTAPIAIRIFKEEGVLEIWKAKTNDRFDKIAEYSICAWSGRLGPKVKEGDRQAPEGFYPLTPYHLNPNSKYFLAINTGYPNRFDQANGRNGSNLMIHGACSSSGCYSMTDAQILEIYAFARDAFKGGQKTIQLQAFPFRMTAENMARHRHSEHFDFWKELKVGYDNFEVTKRPPEVNVCERKYVFNQQVEGTAGFNAAAACPPMSTPPALQVALGSYEMAYARDFDKAAKKFDGKVWYDPSEAERKALVAGERKGHDLAFAPTGSALKAGKFLSEKDIAAAAATPVAMPQATATKTSRIAPQSTAQPGVLPLTTASVSDARQSSETVNATPVPLANPRVETAIADSAPAPKKKPFWKVWAAE